MAGIRMENKIYEVGMYCRLSKDDGTDNESASIATQKSILTDYVDVYKRQEYRNDLTYFTNGQGVCLTELKGYQPATGKLICQPRRPNSRICLLYTSLPKKQQ